MEIPRNWRLKKQRYGLVGLINKKTGEVEFPPKANPKKESNILVYNSSLLLPPDDKIVHCEVVRQDQE